MVGVGVGIGVGVSMGTTAQRPAAPTSTDITSVTDDGSGNALFHTGAAHGLSVGDWVYLAAGMANYSAGVYQVVATPSTTTFTITDDGSSYAGNDTGTWLLGFAITSVTNSSGNAIFHTATAHGLEIHSTAAIAGFNAYASTSNGDVSLVPSATTFAMSGVTYNGDDQGGGAKVA